MAYYSQKRIVPRYSANANYTSAPLDEEGLRAIDAGKEKFRIRHNAFYKPYFPRPQQRYMLLAERLAHYLEGSILDVGSRNTLLSDLTGKKAALVDKHNPNLPPWDWEQERLPYKDSSFDTLVCLDTLEHIDNFHEGFRDLFRVARSTVVISLPNNWKKALNEFLKGRGRWPSYGLPPEKPHDRHKWFFNTEDVEDFMYYHSASSLQNYEVVDVVYHVPKTIWRIRLLYPIFRLVLPEHHFKNLFVETIFVVMKKRS